MRLIDVQELGDLTQQPVGASFEICLTGGEQKIVGEHPDHEAACFDRGLHALGEAVRGGVGVELVLNTSELARRTRRGGGAGGRPRGGGGWGRGARGGCGRRNAARGGAAGGAVLNV